MKVQGQAVPKPMRLVTRKITALYTTVIPPHTRGLVKTKMKPLPKPLRRTVEEDVTAYHVVAQHAKALDVTIDYRTAHVMVVDNDTDEPITITKGQRIGSVEEYSESDIGMWVNLNRVDAEAREYLVKANTQEEFAMWFATREAETYTAVCKRIDELKAEEGCYIASISDPNDQPNTADVEKGSPTKYKQSFYTPSWEI